MSVIKRAEIFNSELSGLHPYDLEEKRFMGTTVLVLAKGIIEYDQALREAISALKPLTQGTYWIDSTDIDQANKVIDKYKHLLKGE